ncbi:receptor-like protein kinase HSL1, partial [Trifolium medium]|nr:receptor-like protein kinase HSL1 [Trifolium medium]
MTSNLTEAMNSVFKDIRIQPITTLVQSTYYRCAELFAKRGRVLAAVLASGHEYTEACQKRILDAV